VHRLLVNYYKYIIKKTKTVANKPSTFNFNKLRKAVKLYIIATKDAKHIVIFLEGNI